jgi:hypothetical protein
LAQLRGGALVSIGRGDDCAVGAAGDRANVSQRFQPSGRAQQRIYSFDDVSDVVTVADAPQSNRISLLTGNFTGKIFDFCCASRWQQTNRPRVQTVATRFPAQQKQGNMRLLFDAEIPHCLGNEVAV